MGWCHVGAIGRPPHQREPPDSVLYFSGNSFKHSESFLLTQLKTKTPIMVFSPFSKCLPSAYYLRGYEYTLWEALVPLSPRPPLPVFQLEQSPPGSPVFPLSFSASWSATALSLLLRPLFRHSWSHGLCFCFNHPPSSLPSALCLPSGRTHGGAGRWVWEGTLSLWG